MAKGDFLGEFEYIVMLSLLRLGDAAYGMTIRQDIEECTERLVAVGAVYAALDRLEDKGYIHSIEGATTRGRGGRSKTYFTVNADGLRAVRQTRSVFRRMEKGAEPKLGSAFRLRVA
jgi:PadR family transcriptional regulator PadR